MRPSSPTDRGASFLWMGRTSAERRKSRQERDAGRILPHESSLTMTGKTQVQHKAKTSIKKAPAMTKHLTILVYTLENYHGTQNRRFEKRMSSSIGWFLGSMLIFGGIYIYICTVVSGFHIPKTQTVETFEDFAYTSAKTMTVGWTWPPWCDQGTSKKILPFGKGLLRGSGYLVSG